MEIEIIQPRLKIWRLLTHPQNELTPDAAMQACNLEITLWGIDNDESHRKRRGCSGEDLANGWAISRDSGQQGANRHPLCLGFEKPVTGDGPPDGASWSMSSLLKFRPGFGLSQCCNLSRKLLWRTCLFFSFFFSQWEGTKNRCFFFLSFFENKELMLGSKRVGSLAKITCML